jgi:hypothetical protein
MRWLTDFLRGGSDDLGWDDVLAKVVDELATGAHYGARGEVTFATAVLVEVAAPGKNLEVVRRFVADPRFDREVGAALANRCDAPAAALPAREYDVVEAARLSARVSARAPRAWQLVVQGGDLHGRVLELPAASGQAELTFGRGDGRASGELAICEHTSFVSRRAGALTRDGAQLEVAALDQGDLLAVRRGGEGGDLIRPSRTARGRANLREGDVIELSDGRGDVVRLLVRRVPVAKGGPGSGA